MRTFFPLLIGVAYLAVVIYVLMLLSQIASGVQRIARSLENREKTSESEADQI